MFDNLTGRLSQVVKTLRGQARITEDNIGDALHTSSFLLERYLEAADTALNQAIANRPQPKASLTRHLLTESHQVRSTTEKVFRTNDTGGTFGSFAAPSRRRRTREPPH